MIIKDEFRKNELSFQPGGVTVKVIYKDGSIREYDKIKNPKAYIRKILLNKNVDIAFVEKTKTN
ncbi:hypothetical protein M0Q50_05785 [bacterium]|jgi:hypothetical protein|nr:hypothetical protein [bacterium]